MTLEMAAEWFERFGRTETCISPTGRRLYAFLLERVRALEGKP